MANNLEREMLRPTVGTLIPHVQRLNYMVIRDGVTLLRIPRSRILRVMAGGRKGCQSSVSFPCTPCCGRTGQGRMQMELFFVQRVDWPAHLFANAMQLFAATMSTTTGMINTRIWKKSQLLTDSNSSAMSLVS